VEVEVGGDRDVVYFPDQRLGQRARQYPVAEVEAVAAQLDVATAAMTSAK
jgi:hypothetical protein